MRSLTSAADFGLSSSFLPASPSFFSSEEERSLRGANGLATPLRSASANTPVSRFAAKFHSTFES